MYLKRDLLAQLLVFAKVLLFELSSVQEFQPKGNTH